MEVIKTESTPSDNPASPANSPPAGALAHGFWRGQVTLHQRSELSSPTDVPSGRNNSDAPTGNMTSKKNYKNLTILDNGAMSSQLKALYASKEAPVGMMASMLAVRRTLRLCLKTYLPID